MVLTYYTICGRVGGGSLVSLHLFQKNKQKISCQEIVTSEGDLAEIWLSEWNEKSLMLFSTFLKL